jgi:hypothetical protein
MNFNVSTAEGRLKSVRLSLQDRIIQLIFSGALKLPESLRENIFIEYFI